MLRIIQIVFLYFFFLLAFSVKAADIPNILVLSDEIDNVLGPSLSECLKRTMVFTEKERDKAAFIPEWKYFDNGSSGILEYLDYSEEEFKEKQIQVLLIGSGQKDIEKDQGSYSIDTLKYRRNLKGILQRAKRLNLEVLWFNNDLKGDSLYNKQIGKTNRIIREIMDEYNIRVIEFQEFIDRMNKEMKRTDTRFTEISNRRKSEFLAESVAQWWTALAITNRSVDHIRLWDELPPFYKKEGEERINAAARIDYVSDPELLYFLPKNHKKATAVIFFPGGGYQYSGFLRNARELSEILDTMNIVVFGLKYRTRRDPEVPLADAQRAIRYVRAHAETFGIDPDRIGVAGQSAGAHLVMNLCSHYSEGNIQATDPIEKVSSRPDFAAVFSSWNFLSQDLPLICRPDTPPFFVRHAKDDNSYLLAQRLVESLERNHIPADVLFLEKGGHGAFEISEGNSGKNWPSDFMQWLKKLNKQTIK